MPTHCPFCAAPLSPTGDAFCGVCRGQLDEAPPAGSTPEDLELRRKIFSGDPGLGAKLFLVAALAAIVLYSLRFLFILFSGR
jgi:hypothetical protein